MLLRFLVMIGLTPVVRTGQISLIISRVCSPLWKTGGGPSQHSRYSVVSTQPPDPTFNPPLVSCCSTPESKPSSFHLLCFSIQIYCSVTDHARNSRLAWGFCFQSGRWCLVDHLKTLLCIEVISDHFLGYLELHIFRTLKCPHIIFQCYLLKLVSAS